MYLPVHYQKLSLVRRRELSNHFILVVKMNVCQNLSETHQLRCRCYFWSEIYVIIHSFCASKHVKILEDDRFLSLIFKAAVRFNLLSLKVLMLSSYLLISGLGFMKSWFESKTLNNPFNLSSCDHHGIKHELFTH